jgi:uncharacterized protein
MSISRPSQKRPNRTTLTIAALALAAAIAKAPPVLSLERVEDVPNPLETSGKYAGDGAGVLGPAYVDLIHDVAVRLKAATGAELAVITVRDLGGTTPEDFAERLFKRFGIGVKGKDNGLLILLAVDERAVRVEVGYGLEPILTDAQAGRLLDDHAVPFLARNEYGRGMYEAAKAAAETIAAASGASLGIASPAAWPDQPQPAPPSREAEKTGRAAEGRQRAGRSSTVPSGILAAAVLALTGLWSLRTRRRFDGKRSRAEKLKAASAGAGFLSLIWTAAPAGVIALLASGGGAAAPLLSALSPVAATVLWSKLRKGLKERAADYKLPCASCGSTMDLVPEDQDDARLSVEEAAEERAGGMDYELWTCPKCGAGERFAVKLGKASACPKCGRRTLIRSRQTLAAATSSHGGRERITDDCNNPKCDYVKTWERTTPRIGTASSSSGRSGFSGSSGSSRSSFGGGRSGGGGATRRF